MAHDQSETTTLGTKHYFLIRRLHSLSGLVPVGIFLCIHLTANSTILFGGNGAEFQTSVDRIHLLGPFLVPVEIVGIFIPILFHALLGVRIMLSSQSNAQQYRYGSNIRYALQRITGGIAFVFIFYHVWQMHWFAKPIGGGAFDAHNAAASAAGIIQSGWWVAPIYAIGTLSSVYHLANGIWTSLITWGITIKPSSQRASGFACAALGVLLALVGMSALTGFRNFNPDQAAAPSAAHTAATHTP